MNGCHHSEPFDLVSIQGAQCAHSAAISGYLVLNSIRCGEPILLQDQDREHWGRQGIAALLEDAVSAAGTALNGQMNRSMAVQRVQSGRRRQGLRIAGDQLRACLKIK